MAEFAGDASGKALVNIRGERQRVAQIFTHPDLSPRFPVYPSIYRSLYTTSPLIPGPDPLILYRPIYPDHLCLSFRGSLYKLTERLN
jgi:hypothetical protein